jgi:hypothetical protein
MGNLMIVIVVNVIALVIFLVYQALLDADRERKRLPEILDKVSKEAAENKKEELIFSQFGEYISSIFAGKEKVVKKELQDKLNHDFPFYKGGNNELFHDLRNARLIKGVREQDDYFELGNTFKNLNLTHPEIIKFLYDTCKENWFKHNIPSWKNSINEAEITQSINLNNETTYFSFGVCLGVELEKKINISSQNNIKPSFYLYGKAYYKNNNNTQDDKITFQDYIQLTPQIDYKAKFLNWLLLSSPL